LRGANLRSAILLTTALLAALAALLAALTGLLLLLAGLLLSAAALLSTTLAALARLLVLLAALATLLSALIWICHWKLHSWLISPALNSQPPKNVPPPAQFGRPGADGT
jgi:hypothetical protein